MLYPDRYIDIRLEDDVPKLNAYRYVLDSATNRSSRDTDVVNQSLAICRRGSMQNLGSNPCLEPHDD